MMGNPLEGVKKLVSFTLSRTDGWIGKASECAR